MVVSFVIMTSSGCIVVVHLLLKELYNTVGKLLMIRSAVLVAYYAGNIVIVILSTRIALKSCLICRILTHITLQAVMIQEACSTCILVHIVRMMHNLKQEMPKHFFKCYMAYLLVTLVVFYVVSIIYDFVTGDDNHLLSPSGHCIFARPATYNIMYVMTAYTTLNKAIQIGLWVIYMCYFYKFTKECVYHETAEITIIIGATVGISQVVWFFTTLSGYVVLKIVTEVLSVAMQQCVIMAMFMFSKKVADLCKAKLFQE